MGAGDRGCGVHGVNVPVDWNHCNRRRVGAECFLFSVRNRHLNGIFL